jgi:taurine dioxygenase
MSIQTSGIEAGHKQNIRIRPLCAALGAEIDCGKLTDLSEGDKRVIYQAWLDHLVLVIHNQKLTDSDLIAVNRIFGKPEFSNVSPKLGIYQEIAVISNVVENGKPIGVFGASEAVWHSDHSWAEKPLCAAMLYALEVPDEGGDTEWNNMYLALETLPTDLRSRVEGLTIKNDGSTNAAGEARTDDVVTDVRTYKGPSHPILRTHPETGYPTLYIGRRRNAYVNGLSLEESEDLLNKLFEHAAQKRFVYNHKWHVGDLVVWDNRCTMHRRDPFDPSARRIMHRAQTAAELAFYRPDIVKPGPHPRGHLVR